jgi:hypothetical protein
MTLTEVVDPSNRDATQWGMFRRVLLVALFCLSAWVTADRVAAFSSDGASAAAGTALHLTEVPVSSHSPDHRLGAGPRTSASVTESIWRSQLHHSELAGVSCPDRCDVIRRGDALPRRPRDAAPHLHSIPLLI